MTFCLRWIVASPGRRGRANVTFVLVWKDAGDLHGGDRSFRIMSLFFFLKKDEEAALAR